MGKGEIVKRLGKGKSCEDGEGRNCGEGRGKGGAVKMGKGETVEREGEREEL